VAEYLVHGYDLARSVGRPWPINPKHAALVLRGYLPMYAPVVDPQTTAGLTAAYRIELRGGSSSPSRSPTACSISILVDTGPVGCTITADPVAFLLAVTGRLPAAAAIAPRCGAYRAAARAALGFADLFVFP